MAVGKREVQLGLSGLALLLCTLVGVLTARYFGLIGAHQTARMHRPPDYQAPAGGSGDAAVAAGQTFEDQGPADPSAPLPLSDFAAEATPIDQQPPADIPSPAPGRLTSGTARRHHLRANGQPRERRPSAQANPASGDADRGENLPIESGDAAGSAWPETASPERAAPLPDEAGADGPAAGGSIENTADDAATVGDRWNAPGAASPEQPGVDDPRSTAAAEQPEWSTPPAARVAQVPRRGRQPMGGDRTATRENPARELPTPAATAEATGQFGGGTEPAAADPWADAQPGSAPQPTADSAATAPSTDPWAQSPAVAEQPLPPTADPRRRAPSEAPAAEPAPADPSGAQFPERAPPVDPWGGRADDAAAERGYPAESAPTETPDEAPIATHSFEGSPTDDGSQPYDNPQPGGGPQPFDPGPAADEGAAEPPGAFDDRAASPAESEGGEAAAGRFRRPDRRVRLAGDSESPAATTEPAAAGEPAPRRRGPREATDPATTPAWAGLRYNVTPVEPSVAPPAELPRTGRAAPRAATGADSAAPGAMAEPLAPETDPATADAETPGATAQPHGPVGGDAYVVGPQETFWTIAQQVYGNGGYFKALYEHNRQTHPRSDRLRPGDRISVPPVESLEAEYRELIPKQVLAHRGRAAAPRPTAPSPPPVASGRTYVVHEGDTLFDIARYELGRARRWQEIYQLNRQLIGEDINHLKPGMELALPAETPGGTLSHQTGDSWRR